LGIFFPSENNAFFETKVLMIEAKTTNYKNKDFWFLANGSSSIDKALSFRSKGL